MIAILESILFNRSLGLFSEQSYNPVGDVGGVIDETLILFECFGKLGELHSELVLKSLSRLNKNKFCVTVRSLLSYSKFYLHVDPFVTDGDGETVGI